MRIDWFKVRELMLAFEEKGVLALSEVKNILGGEEIECTFPGDFKHSSVHPTVWWLWRKGLIQNFPDPFPFQEWDDDTLLSCGYNEIMFFLKNEETLKIILSRIESIGLSPSLDLIRVMCGEAVKQHVSLSAIQQRSPKEENVKNMRTQWDLPGGSEG